MSGTKEVQPDKPPDGRRSGFLASVAAYYGSKTLAEWLAKLIISAAELFAAYHFSKILQSFTDASLWMPVDFREGIAFGSSIIFSTVSELAMLWTNYMLQPRKYYEELPPQEQSGLIIRLFLILPFILAFFYCIWQAHELREASIWPFAPEPGWWARNYGNTETAGFVTNQTEVICSNLPDFLSQERKRFYFPDQVDDPALSNYLVKVGGGDLRKGIKTTLDREPMRLIDWAEGNGKEVRGHYSYRFLLFHLGMITCMAVAVGTLQKKVEVAMEAMFKFFLG